MTKNKKVTLIFVGIIFALVIAFILSNVIYDNDKTKNNIAKLEQDIIESVKYTNEIDEAMIKYTDGYMSNNKGNMAIAATTIKGNILYIQDIVMHIDGHINAGTYVNDIDNAIQDNTEYTDWNSYKQYLTEKYFIDESYEKCVEKFLNKIKK